MSDMSCDILLKSPNLIFSSHVSSSEPFQYVSWELSEEDMEKDAEDIEALAQLERAEEGSDDDYSPGEGNEVSKLRSLSTLISTCLQRYLKL